MKRPIEKYGWKHTGTIPTIKSECFENSLGHEIRIDDKGEILFLNEEAGFDFEVLQAIYETAKQIKEEYERTEKETNENVAEKLKRYEEKNKEYYEECKKAGYRELEKEEISNKSCWTCSHFRGGYIGAGCWCSQEKCDYKENDNVLVPQ